MEGEVRLFTEVDKSEYENYDIIQVNMSTQDLHILGDVREVIGDNSKTKLVANNDYTLELWAQSFPYLSTLKREIQYADMIFGTEPYQVGALELLTGRKVHLITHPAFVKRLKTLKVDSSEKYVSVISHRYDNNNIVPSLALKGIDYKTRLIGYDSNSDSQHFKTTTLYNETMKATNYMDFCFPAGNKIIMGDNSYKNIESVQVGDSVFTIDGEKEVLNTMERKIDEEIYKVSPSGRPSFMVTKNHPFKTEIGEFNTLENINMLRKDIIKLTNLDKITLTEFIPEVLNTRWYEVSDTSIINRVGSTKLSLPKVLKLDRDLGYLIGAFVAEGSYMGDDKGIQITLGLKDKLDKFPEVFKRVFGLDILHTINRKNHTINYYSNSKLIRRVIQLFVGGRVSFNKYLKDLCFSNIEFVKGLLESIIQGDGYYNKRAIEIVTTSEILSNQLLDLFETLHIYPNKYIRHTKGNISYIDGREIKFNSDSYDIRIMAPTYYNLTSELLLNSVLPNKQVYNNRDSSHIWTSDYVLIPFKYETCDYNGIVYNIEVKDNNQYSLNTSTVHNCDQLLESKVVYDPFSLTSQGRVGWDCAALGIPVVGSDRNESYRVCFPKTCVDPYDVKTANKLLKRLIEDTEFRDEVIAYAKEAVNIVSYDNSRKLYLQALEEGSPKLED